MSFRKPLINLSFEDKEVLNGLNNILIKKRGFDFKIPRKGSSVILLLSGGMDSVFLWYLLLNKYQFHVYPLFIKRKRLLDPQKRSVDFFSKYFKKKFPILFHKPRFISMDTDTSDMKNIKEKGKDETDLFNIFDNLSISYQDKEGLLIVPVNPVRIGHFILFAYSYSFLLKIKGIDVNNIFLGHVKDDMFLNREATLTTLRGFNVAICNIFSDWRLQISAPIEKKQHFCLSKKDIVKKSTLVNFPIERTSSCERYLLLQCGFCYKCKKRQEIFYESKIRDKTIYIVPRRIRLFLEYLFKKIEIIGMMSLTFFKKKFIPTVAIVDNSIIIFPNYIKIHEAKNIYYLLNKKSGLIIKINRTGFLIINIIRKNQPIRAIDLLSNIKYLYPKIPVQKVKKAMIAFIKKMVNFNLLIIKND